MRSGIQATLCIQLVKWQKLIGFALDDEIIINYSNLFALKGRGPYSHSLCSPIKTIKSTYLSFISTLPLG